MALCLCETRYSLFRTVKTYEWKESDAGDPWSSVITKWEAWASAQLNKLNAPAFTFDNSTTEAVQCTQLQPQFSKIATDNCRFYNMSRVLETDTEFGIEPEPKTTRPINIQTPPDEVGNETGPYDSDPPGTRWDQRIDWKPTQVGPNCPSSCIDTNGGDFLSMEDDSHQLYAGGNPWKRDTLVPDRYEEVEVKFWLSFKRQEKIGYEKTCCDGNGIDSGLFGYENGWQTVTPDPRYPNSEGGKFYEPEWSGEPAIKVLVPFSLFYQEYNENIYMRKRHACL